MLTVALRRLFVLMTLALAGPAFAQDPSWPAYGGDAGGQKYSPAAQITPSNAAQLTRAWVFQTGDWKRRPNDVKNSSFEDTPILAGGSLIVCSPFNEVIALDPGTGVMKWRFDPKVPTDSEPGNKYVCRGVTQWTDETAAPGAPCAMRLFMGTNDHRLFALDAKTGKRCDAFGTHGEVAIDPGMELRWPGEFQITSPPAVTRGVVIVGSSISDNVRVVAPKGTVRAFDALSGKALWTFDPLQRAADGSPTAGHGNVWAPMSVDEASGLVYLPTSSPSPDFYGSLRPGDDRYANSVVALDAVTGKVVWSFQTVHHDLWDYDVASQPALSVLDVGGAPHAAVFQGTKMGLIFALDRASGQPLFPVEERAVPKSDVPGEPTSPTQPFPSKPPPLVPPLEPGKAWGMTPFDKGACKEALSKLRYEGMYTPPSLQGTALYPFTGGGINWGGIAIDPVRQILIANTMRLVHVVKLVPQDQFDTAHNKNRHGDWGHQRGAPYGVYRDVVMSPLGAPCNAPPWGMIHAIDLKTGAIKWEQPFGTAQDLVPLGDLWLPKGVPNIGGPIVTASGLIFVGATHDANFRAYDVETGKEVFKARLPAGGQATPMTYVWQGRQYVVIAAGGNGMMHTTPGDFVIAFALPGKSP